MENGCKGSNHSHGMRWVAPSCTQAAEEACLVSVALSMRSTHKVSCQEHLCPPTAQPIPLLNHYWSRLHSHSDLHPNTCRSCSPQLLSPLPPLVKAALPHHPTPFSTLVEAAQPSYSAPSSILVRAAWPIPSPPQHLQRLLGPLLPPSSLPLLAVTQA